MGALHPGFPRLAARIAAVNAQPSTASPSVLSDVAQLATAAHLRFSQDWTQTPYSAHPDYFYPQRVHTPTFACVTGAPSLPQAQQSSEFLSLPTDPGTVFAAPMPSGFDLPARSGSRTWTRCWTRTRCLCPVDSPYYA